MVEKNHSHHIRIVPKTTSFKAVEHSLVSWYDEGLLKKHLPPTSGVASADAALVKGLSKYLPEDTKVALASTEFVSVFGRVVQRKDRKGPLCLQYLYVWDYQAVPLHEADYEPIYVFIEDDYRYALYDLVHYCTRRIDFGPLGKDGPGLRVVPGWHSFLPATLKASQIDAGLKLKPLSDQHLESWWNIPDEATRLKIEGFMRDPFALKSPGHFMDSPDEEARTMCCTFTEIEGAFKDFENPKEAIIEGFKRAFARCIGIFALHRIPAFIKLLSEMSDVGIITIPPALKQGINIAAIGSLLSEGFVTLTDRGRSFLEGLKDER